MSFVGSFFGFYVKCWRDFREKQVDTVFMDFNMLFLMGLFLKACRSKEIKNKHAYDVVVGGLLDT